MVATFQDCQPAMKLHCLNDSERQFRKLPGIAKAQGNISTIAKKEYSINFRQPSALRFFLPATNSIRGASNRWLRRLPRLRGNFR